MSSRYNDNSPYTSGSAGSSKRPRGFQDEGRDQGRSYQRYDHDERSHQKSQRGTDRDWRQQRESWGSFHNHSNAEHHSFTKDNGQREVRSGHYTSATLQDLTPRDGRNSRPHARLTNNLGNESQTKAVPRHREDVPQLTSALKRKSSPVEDIEYELQTEEEQARLIEEQRKRRQAILQKHRESPTTGDAVKAGPASVNEVEIDSSRGASQRSSRQASIELRGEVRASSSRQTPESELNDEKFDLAKRDSSRSDVSSVPGKDQGDGKGISAADYDPSFDRAMDEERAHEHLRKQGATQPPPPPMTTPGVADGIGESKERVRDDPKQGDESEYEEVEVDDENDFDDMFAIGTNDVGEEKKKKTVKVKKGTKVTTNKLGPSAAAATLHDNWDDPEGYYRVVLGERFGEGGRYQIFASLGRGMFSSVVKARDMAPGQGEREVAIKIVRTQETMYKAGLKEMNVLRKLAEMDPEDKRHLVRLEGHFEHRNHLCMVFESLSMNLREVVKRFGKDVGLNLRAIRAYAHQMFLALSLMRKAEIMHADIKPDNILVNETKSMLKICDLGSASDVSEMEITPYLVSRFYRAPEIILGLPYDCALDMWSIGCTLYELYTGKILFPGRTNNHMLLLIQELRGKFTTKQIRKAQFSNRHFDEQNNFLSRERDKNTGMEVIRKIVNFPNGNEEIKNRILPGNTAKGLLDSDLRMTNLFVDLLSKTLDIDPSKRITPHQALQHSFFAG